MESILNEMPVQIIVNDNCGLVGAALYTLVHKAFRRNTRGGVIRG